MLRYVLEAVGKFMPFLFLCTFLVPASAAEFTSSCPSPAQPNVGCSIFLRGPIVPGDSAALMAILKIPPKGSDIYRWVRLDSPGGDVTEAIKLTKIVRDALLETTKAMVNK